MTAGTIVANASQPDCDWLAGYLEGEGCFFNTASRHTVCPLIQVAATDWDVVFRAASIMGVLVNKVSVRKRKEKPYYKDCWKFYVGSHLAAAWMRRLLPLMGLRRRKTIQSILSFYDGGRLYEVAGGP